MSSIGIIEGIILVLLFRGGLLVGREVGQANAAYTFGFGHSID